MLLVWNLGLPWLLIWAIALLQPTAAPSHHWILDGLRDNLSLYGFSVHSARHGFLGFFLPLIILHNAVFLAVRFIQSRLQLDFLPMIRNVLLWIAMGLLVYLCWLSFNRGARYGDFHAWSLFLLPLLAFLLGLGFFVAKDKYWPAAQITALLVAWSPVFSIIASLAGNHLRPHNLFEEVVWEPGGAVWGWSAREAPQRASEYLRLRLIKEGAQWELPSLARHLRVDQDSQGHVQSLSADLDPVRSFELFSLPEQLEDLGWRASADNSQLLTKFCAAHAPSAPIDLRWQRSNAQLKLHIERCSQMASWSLSTSLVASTLGDLDVARAQRIAEERSRQNIALREVDSSLLRGQDWRQRKLGLELVSLVNHEEALPLLLQGFYDPDLEVRQAAATGLLSWGPRAEASLSKALVDRNPSMRGDALRILAQANRHLPHPAALRLLADDSEYVRISAVRALSPFVKDNAVLKALMAEFNRVYDRAQDKEKFLEDDFNAELLMALAASQDVRVATLLMKGLPRQGATSEMARRSEALAAQSLRSMKTWMGVDYLQSLVRRGSVTESREKALSLMQRWRRAGDDEVFAKALKDPALQPYALKMAAAFDKNPAVQTALKAISSPLAQPSPSASEDLKMQAR